MSLSEIHNYYEDLVENYIDALELNQTRSSDYLSDLYCLALNQLPVHYIRHGVDMYFYMSDEKRQEMEEKVIYAVTSAISWLDNEEKEKMREKQRLKNIYFLLGNASSDNSLKKSYLRTTLILIKRRTSILLRLKML